MPEKPMLLDQHNHTIPRSLDSSLMPRELVKRARERGVDAICLTEHDAAWDSRGVEDLALDAGVLVLPGMEITTNAGHILVFGLDRYTSEMTNARKLRRIADAEGGVMVLAHPYRKSAYVHPINGVTPAGGTGAVSEALPPLDAAEVLNGTGSSADNALSLDVSQVLGLPGTGGSDAHSPSEVARCASIFHGAIGSLADLMVELKRGQFEAHRVAPREGVSGRAF